MSRPIIHKKQCVQFLGATNSLTVVGFGGGSEYLTRRGTKDFLARLDVNVKEFEEVIGKVFFGIWGRLLQSRF